MPDYLGDLLPGPDPPNGDPLNRAFGGLNPGDNLFSQKRNFVLSFQEDGNLVLYGIDPGSVPLNTFKLDKTKANYDRVIFQVNPSGLPNYDSPFLSANECALQGDGNFVLHGYVPVNRPYQDPIITNAVIWQSGTNGHNGAFLRCQNDGNLVVYWLDGNNRMQALWNSRTNAGLR